MASSTIDAPWLGIALVFAFTGLPALLAYAFAWRSHRRLQHMLREWSRLPGVVVACEWTPCGEGKWRYVPTVEWSPEGRVVRFRPDDHRRRPPWTIGERVTVLRHPSNWQASRLLDEARMYREEVWHLVVGGTLALLMLLAGVADIVGWIPAAAP